MKKSAQPEKTAQQKRLSSKEGRLYTVKIHTTTETANILEELFPSKDLYPSSFSSSMSCDTSIYFYNIDLAQARKLETHLNHYMAEWSDFAELGHFSITIEEFKKEDWSESWKRFFHTKKVSDRVVVSPSWKNYHPRKGEILVEIDPGMSFGTGLHPTTRSCIHFLDKLSQAHMIGSVIDIGCGSGILSIVAFKIGFQPISAFDHDPESVRITTENVKLAKIEAFVKPFEQSIEKYEALANFDVVVVNILAKVLISNTGNIVNALKKRDTSRLILSGVLTEEYKDVLKLFQNEGLRELEHLVMGEWTTGLLGVDTDRNALE